MGEAWQGGGGGRDTTTCWGGADCLPSTFHGAFFVVLFFLGQVKKYLTVFVHVMIERFLRFRETARSLCLEHDGTFFFGKVAKRY